MTAQPLLRGEAGPVNDAQPVLLGRVGRRGAPLHGYCGKLLYAVAIQTYLILLEAVGKESLVLY